MTAIRLPVRSAAPRELDPALVPGAVDDRQLDLLDGDRVGVDGQDAGRLARRRAQPAGELREVVRRVQTLDGRTPVVVGDELVPLRDQVAERAAGVTEGDTAVHAPAGLDPDVRGSGPAVDRVPVTQALRDRSLGRLRPRQAEKSPGVGDHGAPPEFERRLTDSSETTPAREINPMLPARNGPGSEQVGAAPLLAEHVLGEERGDRLVPDLHVSGREDPVVLVREVEELAPAPRTAPRSYQSRRASPIGTR